MGARAIHSITLHLPACIALFEAGAISSLVNLLDSSDADLQDSAMSGLGRIMSSVEDARVAAFEAGAIPHKSSFSLLRMTSLDMLLRLSIPLLSIPRHAQHHSRQEQSLTHPMPTLMLSQQQLWQTSCHLWKMHELPHSKQESSHI
jgi:hypothetical protein